MIRGPRPCELGVLRYPGQGTRAIVDGSSLVLDLDGVVVESVERLADGTRLVGVVTAPHPLEGLGGDRTL